MEFTEIFRQLLVFLHLFTFTFAIAEVIKHDIQILKKKQLRGDVAELGQAANRLTWLLATLWITGTILIYMAVGTDLEMLLSNAKLMAKITVVGVLTINGFLLHKFAFPMMTGQRNLNATLCSILGAISTTCWIYSSLVGACRILGPSLSYNHFMSIFALALCFALIICLSFVRLLLSNGQTGSESALGKAASA